MHGRKAVSLAALLGALIVLLAVAPGGTAGDESDWIDCVISTDEHQRYEAFRQARRQRTLGQEEG